MSQATGSQAARMTTFTKMNARLMTNYDMQKTHPAADLDCS